LRSRSRVTCAVTSVSRGASRLRQAATALERPRPPPRFQSAHLPSPRTLANLAVSPLATLRHTACALRVRCALVAQVRLRPGLLCSARAPRALRAHTLRARAPAGRRDLPARRDGRLRDRLARRARLLRKPLPPRKGAARAATRCESGSRASGCRSRPHAATGPPPDQPPDAARGRGRSDPSVLPPACPSVCLSA
jgi:hypothetical protein